MSDKKMPAFRLKYRDKESKITYDCGVFWPGRFDDSFDGQPQIGNVAHEKFPKMDSSEAFRLAADKRGWISLSKVRAAAAPGRPAHNLGGFGDAKSAFDDPDVPF